MRLWLLVILALVLIGVSAQIYFILKERGQLKNTLSELNFKMDSLAKENDDLKNEIQYLSNPENLLKELKSKFNYKEPGENLMIVVP